MHVLYLILCHKEANEDKSVLNPKSGRTLQEGCTELKIEYLTNIKQLPKHAAGNGNRMNTLFTYSFNSLQKYLYLKVYHLKNVTEEMLFLLLQVGNTQLGFKLLCLPMSILNVTCFHGNGTV